jgi:hypothetical protein
VVMGNLVVYGWEYRGSRVWAIERDGLGQMASPVVSSTTLFDIGLTIFVI